MSTKTLSTLVAIFRTDAEARSAADDLKSNGFNAGDIFITADNGHTSHESTHEYSHHEGGIKGWFKSLMGEEDEQTYEGTATNYEGAVNSGQVLLSVDTNENNIDTAADILNRHSPVDVHRDTAEASTSEVRDTAARPATSTQKTAVDAAAVNENEAIPVMREELAVGKRSVLRGGVRVYSRVVEQPVEETVRLRQETVHVDRTPVNREVTDADLRRGQEKVIEVKEFAEEAVVSKTARVVEEVRVRKDATERDETVRETVRHTEVQVENIAGGAAAEDYTTDFRNNFKQKYGSTGETYDSYAPAYQYGYTMASDPRYKGRSFDEVESDLSADYARQYPQSTWQKMKDSVRYGWDRLTNRR